MSDTDTHSIGMACFTERGVVYTDTPLCMIPTASVCRTYLTGSWEAVCIDTDTLPVRCTRQPYESHLTQSCVYNGHIHSGSHRSTPGIRSTRRGEYRTALDSRTWSRAGSSIVSVSVWSHPCLYDAAAYVWGICQGGMWAGYVRMRRRRQQPCGSAAVWRETARGRARAVDGR